MLAINKEYDHDMCWRSRMIMIMACVGDQINQNKWRNWSEQMKKLIRTNEGTDQDKWRNWSEQMKKLIRRVCLKTSFKGEWVNHVSQEALVKFFVNFLVAPTHCVHLKKVNFEAMHPKPYRSGGIRLRNNYIWPPCFWKFTWCCTKTWLY